MARIMAIDYGLKRCGLAITDPLQIIASPLDTVPTSELLDFLIAYCSKEEVSTFVIGEPKTLDNKQSEIASNVNGFIYALHKKIPQIPVKRLDERFTSILAQRAMLSGGLKKKDRQNKATVDKVSATILLQDYLERHAK